MVSLKDIADVCGVSVSTVSQILNDKPSNYSSAATRQRVRETASRLGYRVNFGYRLMRGKKTRTVAIIAAQRHRPQEEHVRNLVISLILKLEALEFATHFATTGMDDLENVGKIRELLNRGAEHFIFLYRPYNHEVLTSLLDEVGKSWISTSSMMRRHVAVDTLSAIRELMTMFYQRFGRRFRYLAPLSGELPLQDTRLQALAQAIPQLSMDEILRDHVHQCPAAEVDENFTENCFHCGYSGMTELLNKEPDVAAVQCSNDDYLIGAAKAAVAAGRIPGHDLHLGGFNGDRAVLNYPYPLATARYDDAKLIDLLVKHARDKEDCRIVLSPEIIYAPWQLPHSCDRPLTTSSC